MPDPNNEDQKADEATAKAEPVEIDTSAEIEKRERRAKLAAHPHTQLRAILSDMQSPAAQRGDINTKHAMLHASVSRLAQLILGATPPPDDSAEKINEDFERQQQHAEGHDA